MNSTPETQVSSGTEIAIIGMACRFPGAADVEQFWSNLSAGVESITFFSDDELEAAGISPEQLKNPRYVRAAPIVQEADLFDAAFFDFTPREAELMDPQQRLFLECAWRALEHASYAPDKYKGTIGVFAGGRMSTYVFGIYSNPELRATLDPLQIAVGNDIGLLSMLVSYKLDLKGPSYFLQTACSTGLVAVHVARQSLLTGECDMALAGAVAIDVPQKKGYIHQQGGILSADGHVRTFDAAASGTVFGNGVGVVVLKRLADAVADGDRIYAAIRGSATNNDGAAKATFTAPSVDGQAKVIRAALVDAEVDPVSIGYVESHGTGTALGDPIEVRALAKAFRAAGQRKRCCALGSVKTNVGHIDAAAGMAGLIKAALALDRHLLPPTLHYQTANPEIDFNNSPFYVNTEPLLWESQGVPRRAGVSAFGFGGTNCHVILEEAPASREREPSRAWQLLTLSAKSTAVLDVATAALATHLEAHTGLDLGDAAFSLHLGRKEFLHRRALICSSVAGAIDALRGADAQNVMMGAPKTLDRPVVFMFSGQGAQYVNMGRELYSTERGFRDAIDECEKRLRPELGLNIREVLYPSEDRRAEAVGQLEQTAVAQPALFVVEYALARLWTEWGVAPQAMIGHSIGEYVAACLAGVFSLEDALRLVAVRGRLMQAQPRGAMLAVSLSQEDVRNYIGDRLDIAAVNSSSRCVISGPCDAVEELRSALTQRGAVCRLLHVSHAFHSSMMDPVLEPFAGVLKGIQLAAPKIPFISNLTGTWITPDLATDPGYWLRHLRATVRFLDGLQELLADAGRILLEVGPGTTLCSLAREHPARTAQHVVVASSRHPEDARPDLATLLGALGRLWVAGARIDWHGFHAHEKRHRIPLPTYPFERQRYWIEAVNHGQSAPTAQTTRRIRKNQDVSEWFYLPVWDRTSSPAPINVQQIQNDDHLSVVFDDGGPIAAALAQLLQTAGQQVVRVRQGTEFTKPDPGTYIINPRSAEHYHRIFRETGVAPKSIVHCWSLTEGDPETSNPDSFDKAQDSGYHSLLFIGHALAAEKRDGSIRLLVLTNYLQDISGTEKVLPEKGTLLGPCLVMPQEQQNVTCRCVDIGVHDVRADALAPMLLAELESGTSEVMVAYRGQRRYVQSFKQTPLAKDGRVHRAIRQHGVYLITGGLGTVGLLLADHLASTAQARLVLLGRSTFPERAQWTNWLETHPAHDATSRRIKRLLAMEARGSSVMVVRGDVANPDEMAAVVERIHERWGALHGVIHAAGMLSGRSIYRPLTEIGSEESRDQFRPKAHGLYALEKVLSGRDLDFCLLLSSNVAVLGGLGFVAYAAANLFMDAFAGDRSRRSRTPWISSNWDEWPAEREGREAALQTSMSEFAMTAEEGADAFTRVVSQADAGQVVISTGDIDARLDLWVRRVTGGAKGTGTMHARPALATAYEEPRNHLERKIADVWSEVLGIKQIGIHDNFFDLGGHSLLATQIMSRLCDVFQVDIPLQRLFEGPTVAKLAAVVVSLHAERTDAAVVSQVLAGIQELSDDEVERMLAAEQTREQEDTHE